MDTSVLPPRFWNAVAAGTGGCWIWIRQRYPGGYGKYVLPKSKRKGALAHRVAYLALVGPIPEGLFLDHLCRVRECVNPAHLEPVTHAENLRRSPLTLGSINTVKTHCPRGHELAGDNLVPSDLPKGKRNCLTCSRARSLAYGAKMRAIRDGKTQ